MRQNLFIVFFLLLASTSYSQILKVPDGFYNNNSVNIKIGDTLRLGFGTGTDKDFLFVMQLPSAWNTSVAYDKIYYKYLNHQYSNQFMVYGETASKKHKDIPVFYVNGDRKMKYIVDLTNAIKSGEIDAAKAQ